VTWKKKGVSMKTEYKYRAEVYRVVDGDTLYCKADLGFGITKDVKGRLLGINAPETRGKQRPQGLIAKDALKDKIEGKDVVIRTHKTGKYGRWIVEVWFGPININKWMVKNGYAVEKTY
jgi:micrococcal nuclease